MIWVAAAAATRLGGGGAPDIPVARIVLAFLLCIALAGLAILLLRQRGAPLAWRRIGEARGAIEIGEVRRLTLHADIGVVRHAGREYLLLVQAGAASVLHERDVDEGPAA